MTQEGMGSDVGQSPELVRRFTAATRRGTHLPILAKMTPNIGQMTPWRSPPTKEEPPG